MLVALGVETLEDLNGYSQAIASYDVIHVI
jgi:hypothetical protein